MSVYSNKEKKFMTKYLLDLIDDPQVSMATIPRKDGLPELALLKQEVFTDLVGERDQLKKWAWLCCQGIIELDVNSSKLGDNIRGLMLMAADAGARFFGMEDKEVAAETEAVNE